MILGFILFVLVLAVNLVNDYKLWLSNKPVRHKLQFVLRVLLLMPSIFLLKGNGYIYSAAFVGVLYWFLFDGLYNVLRGFEWTFEGSIDKDESWFDNLGRKLGKNTTLAIKVIFIILLIKLNFI